MLEKKDIKINKKRETIKAFLSLIEKAEKETEFLNQEISDCDKAIEDLLHDIEFDNFYRTEGHHKARQIKEIRQRRREAKDLLRYTTPIRDFLRSNQKIRNELHKILAGFDYTEEMQKKRVYTPRVLNELPTANQHFSCIVEEQENAELKRKLRNEKRRARRAAAKNMMEAKIAEVG